MTETSEPIKPATLTFEGPRGPLFKALAEARKHFKPLTASSKADVKMKSGGEYSFHYAPLDVVIAAIDPGLQAAGLTLLQPFDGDTLFTIVACGESSMTIAMPLPAWAGCQELGSTLTYLRRYQIKGLFGVADEEDDDGAKASGHKADITRKVRPGSSGYPEPRPGTQQPDLPKPLLDTIVGSAKALGLGKDEFRAACEKATGKVWSALNEADGKKFLAALEVTNLEAAS